MVSKNLLIPFLIKKVFQNPTLEHKHYIIMADSGMGKTTFMINLFYAYSKKRSLFKRKFEQLLLPLGDSDALLPIKDVVDPEHTILLLDAFDENNDATIDYKSQLDNIIKLTKSFNAVIITCRTQFFASEEEEPSKVGLFKYGGQKGQFEFVKLYVSPFDEKDINRFLRAKYPLYKYFYRKKAMTVIKRSPNLMVRPILLTYIDDLIKPNNIQNDNLYSFTYEIYAQLIEKWIERESSQSKKPNFKHDLYCFSTEIAIDIFQNRFERGGLFIDSDSIQEFATTTSIDLSLLEMKSRSLLNRNNDKRWKFSHRSILEFFLAKHATLNVEFLKTSNFEGMDNVRLFLHEIFYNTVFNNFLAMFPEFQFDYVSKSSGSIEKMTRSQFSSARFRDVALISMDRGYLDFYDIVKIMFLFPSMNYFSSKRTDNLFDLSSQYSNCLYIINQPNGNLLGGHFSEYERQQAKKVLYSLEFEFKKFERFEKKLKFILN